jgi:carbonic anhydrase
MNFYYDTQNDVAYPEPFSYYKYQGSRTQPPCEESVTWIVASQVMPVSSTVIAMIRDALNVPL